MLTYTLTVTEILSEVDVSSTADGKELGQRLAAALEGHVPLGSFVPSPGFELIVRWLGTNPEVPQICSRACSSGPFAHTITVPHISLGLQATHNRQSAEDKARSGLVALGIHAGPLPFHIPRTGRLQSHFDARRKVKQLEWRVCTV
jgi:hypothetical protein